jgi:hypothetical protein
MAHEGAPSVHEGARAVTVRMPGPDECIAFPQNALDASCRDLERIAKEKSEDRIWENIGYALASIGLSSFLTEVSLPDKRLWLVSGTVGLFLVGVVAVIASYRLTARSRASVSLVLGRLQSARDACMARVAPTQAPHRSLEPGGGPPTGWQLILDNDTSDPLPPEPNQT